MKVVIIGGQAGGMSCAAKLKRLMPNCNITVFERSDYISFGACGLPYFVGNFFSNENYMFAKTASDFASIGVNINLKSSVLSVNSNDQLITVQNLITNEVYQESYDKLVIATGSSPRKLDENILSNASSTKNIHQLTLLDDAKIIKTRLSEGNIKEVIVLGAGYIGLELLESIKAYKNININLVDSKNSIVDNLLDKDFEEIIKNEIEKHNINLILGQSPSKIYEKNNKVYLELPNKTLEADMLISAIGFIPNTGFLSKLNFDKLPNGALLVNSKGETSIKNIYACGDAVALKHKILGVYKYIPLATLANKLARIIADNIAGYQEELLGVLGSSSLKVLNLEIAKTGITEFEAIKHNIPHKSVFVKDFNHTNYYPNMERLFAKLVLSEDHSKILGATLVGKDGAALRNHALTIAIEKEVSPEELGMMDFAYSPPFTRTWEFLNVLGNVSAKK